jgi:hypothetical protein
LFESKTFQAKQEPPVSNNLVLLDVDGVLNASPIWDPHSKEHGCPWPRGWRTFKAGRYEMRFAPDLCDALLRIHESGLAEVRWLTTWGHDANAVLAAGFGFPRFEVVGSPPPIGEGEGWWKYPLAVAAAVSAERVVWADDDLPQAREAWAWAQSEPGVLPLAPDHYTGLTPADIERATDFLLRQQGSVGKGGSYESWAS